MNMEEIRVYLSIWRNVFNLLVCLAFTAGSVALLADGKNPIIGWMALIFFGLGSLVFLYLLVRQMITHKPYLVITDKAVVMNSGPKSYEIPFADVDAFLMTGVFGNKMIGIRYTKEAEAKQTAEASSAGRAVRKFNKFVSGVPGALPASDLSIRPRVLLELLNERLEAFRKQQ